MAWRVDLSAEAVRQLDKLDKQPSRRVLKLLRQRVAKLDNPRSIGQGPRGSEFGEFWEYRIGDYRLICKIEDDRVVVLVLRIGHRREVYR
jgi:mRNA interferase RelE/StbE